MKRRIKGLKESWVNRIKITNLNKRYKLNEVFIKNIITKILMYFKRPLITELEVIFLDDNSIKSLNKRFKRRDRPTDVLSFKMDLEEFGSKGYAGEIFISLDTAFRNAKVFKTSFQKEVTLYMVHAMLHLFGYEDEKTKDRLKMSKKESDILDRLCEKEDLSKVLMPR